MMKGRSERLTSSIFTLQITADARVATEFVATYGVEEQRLLLSFLNITGSIPDQTGDLLRTLHHKCP